MVMIIYQKKIKMKNDEVLVLRMYRRPHTVAEQQESAII